MYPKYAFKELVRRRSKTTTTVLIVAVVASILVLFSGVMDAYSSGIYRPFKGIGSDMVLQKSENTTTGIDSKIRMPFGKGAFSEHEIDSLPGLDHIMDMSGSLIIWDFGRSGFTTIEGIEPGSFIGNKLSSEIKEGSLAENEAVAESHFANFNHLKTGDSIMIGNESFRISGIAGITDESQVFSSNIYMELKDAQRISGIEGYNNVYLRIDKLSNEEAVKREVIGLDSNITVISGNSLAASLSNVARIFSRFYYLGAGMIVLVTVLILLKANTINLLERKKDIAVMRTVGWTRNDLTKQIMTEMCIQTVLGFLIGLLVSFIVILFFGSISIRAAGSGLGEGAISIPIRLSLGSISMYFVIIVAVSASVSLMLIRKISGIKPSDNLRSM